MNEAYTKTFLTADCIGDQSMSYKRNHVVIIGGGFAGVNAATILAAKKFSVTIVDKNNYHLFQPLLYQVATGFLSPGNIAAPLRSIFARRTNVKVIQGEVREVDLAKREVILADGTLCYDSLIVATGVTHSYFGHDAWEDHAPGLKTIEDALEIRRRVLSALERAERSSTEEEKKKLLRFVIVGGGPTGVELAGALGELTRNTLKGEFHEIDPAKAEIILVEGTERVLSTFHTKTSRYAARQLERLGVSVWNNSLVRDVHANALEIEREGNRTRLEAGTILWAAGVKASPMAETLTRGQAELLDRLGRIRVTQELTLPDHPEVFVTGDLALVVSAEGREVPGVAPAAIQQGRYAARTIIRRARRKRVQPFRYWDKGSMAVIGRGHAVAETWKLRFWGFPGWVAWAFVHIYFLIEFQNKLIVFMQWIWNYLTDRRGSRLITAARRR